jgi:hypothetical protein
MKSETVGRLTRSLPLTRPPACPSMSLGARRLHSVKRHRVDVRRGERPTIGMASDTDALQISSLFLFAAGVY